MEAAPDEAGREFDCAWGAGVVRSRNQGAQKTIQAATSPPATTVYYDTNGTADDVTIADCRA